ncbi:MAG: hypothetical protein AAGC60_05660 [Acidobacteriota bacterium]
MIVNPSCLRKGDADACEVERIAAAVAEGQTRSDRAENRLGSLGLHPLSPTLLEVVIDEASRELAFPREIRLRDGQLEIVADGMVFDVDLRVAGDAQLLAAHVQHAIEICRRYREPAPSRFGPVVFPGG